MDDDQRNLLFFFCAVLNVTGPIILTEEYLIGLDLKNKEIVIEEDVPTASWVIKLRKVNHAGNTSEANTSKQ
jgi:hypothetical protein